MIDRQARDVAAEVLQEFLDGSITNYEYERRYPQSKDPALWGIYSNLWFSYSDTSEHLLLGNHEPTAEGKLIIQRCILFMKSNSEFRWPTSALRILYPLLRLVGLGRLMNRQIEKEMSGGDIEVWPFFDVEEYREIYAKYARL